MWYGASLNRVFFFFHKCMLSSEAEAFSFSMFSAFSLQCGNFHWLWSVKLNLSADGSDSSWQLQWLNFSTPSPCFTNWRILFSHYWFAHNKINHQSINLICIPYQLKAPPSVSANEPADRALCRSPRVLWDVFKPSVAASCPLCQIPFNHFYWLFLIAAFGFHLVWWTLCNKNDTPSAICSEHRADLVIRHVASIPRRQLITMQRQSCLTTVEIPRAAD